MATVTDSLIDCTCRLHLQTAPASENLVPPPGAVSIFSAIPRKMTVLSFLFSYLNVCMVKFFGSMFTDRRCR